ncbi:2',3'-cyclic-nucleotide 2'-phosphodiesterase [Roseibacterium elongatum DSM 19469]|uniref:2',3'-cyclic-nucleotide 2'-phosphodiesterase n=1 Tax=Roseicyclus elongatus DSM 19469 TaxID=1294273 RepID=W8S2W5_9RHOB|nr:bifunctional 2',3'-cyclic-nucleotide 2'-phosphodiesterase/3'-nucleotidase [Roseibacterium elongatum]AHM03086.1 2',3'-cyclic-nucleotide 2'-phosphodiesterase [Roseibacterium elongatum DSM 19469]
MTFRGDIAQAVTRRSDGASAVACVDLRILATSDLHAHLMPYDYFRDCPDDKVGLLRVAERIIAARAACENTLLLDNGDTLQGAPLGDAAVSEIMPRGRTHPMIAAMNTLGYDAATLGNHDFDFGLEALAAAMAGACFPVVLANIRRTDGVPLAPPRALLRRKVVARCGTSHTLRIGVTGVAPPQIARWSRKRLGDRIQVADMPRIAARQARALRREGADLVIVLAHSGLGAAVAETGMENAAHLLAALPDVDAVIAGHSHRVFPDADHPEGLLAGTPVVQPGFHGSHLGCIDLTLSRTRPEVADGPGPHWSVSGARARTLPLSPTPGTGLRRVFRHHPALIPTARAEHRAVRRYAAQPLGESAVPLETYFSLIAPCAATQLVADAQADAARALIAQRPDLTHLPLISAVAPYKCGGRGGPSNYTDIPAGTLRLRNAADLYIYPNQLCVLRLTGADVKDWLERVASAFHRIRPDAPDAAPQPLIDHAFAGYNFDHLVGLRYRFDLSQPARTDAEGAQFFATPGRVRDLCHADGTALQADDTVLVATNSYRSEGGGHFPICAKAETIATAPGNLRDAVIDRIAAATAPLSPQVAHGFSFVPLGGTPVLFETGPGAAHHAARARALGLTPLGLQESGFFGYRMVL